jgi:DHA3 family macrolide efflux protein-like MFS transporter
LNQSVQGGLLIVTAPLGALLVGWLPMGWVLLIDVCTALCALGPLAAIHVPRPPAVAREGSRLREEIAAGFSYLWRRPGHLALVGICAGINLFVAPAFSLLPLLVLDGLGGTAMHLGGSTSAFGAGCLVGGILLGVWGGFNRRIVTALVALNVLGIGVLALGLTPSWLVASAMVSMFLVGCAVPSVNGPILAVLQATVAAEFQGRVFTLIGSLAAITAPIGLLLAAPVAELVGVRAWYIAGACACIVLSVAAFFVPGILEIEDGAETSSA